MNDALAIFCFLRDQARRGERAVLVTLTGVEGSTARTIGTHMAVAEDGMSVGSFSGGCVEEAVIAEALDALAEGFARSVRFGVGSRYIDIRLPCGGGIDLHFAPDPPAEVVERTCTLLEARKSVSLSIMTNGSLATGTPAPGDKAIWQGDRFTVRHDPVLRMAIMGHGSEPVALLRMAAAYGADATVLSPDEAIVRQAGKLGYPAERLRTLGPSPALAVDPWSAVVALFHDHDWETALLLQALERQPFFIGAMGSRRTHAERCSRLIAAGGEPERIDQIRGPIGLIPASRDPATLAVSIMAEVVAAYDNKLRSGDAASTSSSTVKDAHRTIENQQRDEVGQPALPSRTA